MLPNTCCCCCYFCRRRLGAVWKYYSQLHRRAIIVSCAKKSNNFFCFFFFFNSRFMDYSVSWQFSVLPRLLRLLRGAVLLRDVEHRPIVSFSVLQSSYFIFFSSFSRPLYSRFLPSVRFCPSCVSSTSSQMPRKDLFHPIHRRVELQAQHENSRHD